MDNEILYGMDDAGNQRNVNVQNVSHTGVELEGLVKLTPSWTRERKLDQAEGACPKQLPPCFNPPQSA